MSDANVNLAGVKPSEKIQRVTEWPSQKGKAEAKVPTLVWYDQNQNVGFIFLNWHPLTRAHIGYQTGR